MWVRKSRNCGNGEFTSLRAACEGRLQAKRIATSAGFRGAGEVLCLQPIRMLILLRALGLILRRWKRVAGLATRAVLRGKESPKRRAKALLHTYLGAYYAVLLRGHRVDHIHVHHGYFGSWIAMVAARLLGLEFSLTLHGSDLLLDGAYLDAKLKYCRFCVTISEYNRRYILQHFPAIDPRKIVVSRLGADVPARAEFPRPRTNGAARHTFTLLSVGRLHAVKDHAFLVRACARLREGGLNFECAIAGEGPERQRLELLIRQNGMQDRVTLLGHVASAADGFSLPVSRCGCAHQPQRRNSTCPDGSDGPRQDCARACDYGYPRACHSREDRLPLRSGGNKGFRGKDPLP